LKTATSLKKKVLDLLKAHPKGLTDKQIATHLKVAPVKSTMARFLLFKEGALKVENALVDGKSRKIWVYIEPAKTERPAKVFNVTKTGALENLKLITQINEGIQVIQKTPVLSSHLLRTSDLRFIHNMLKKSLQILEKTGSLTPDQLEQLIIGCSIKLPPSDSTN